MLRGPILGLNTNQHKHHFSAQVTLIRQKQEGICFTPNLTIIKANIKTINWISAIYLKRFNKVHDVLSFNDIIQLLCQHLTHRDGLLPVFNSLIARQMLKVTSIR